MGILKIIPSGKIESPDTESVNLVTENLNAAGITINLQLDEAEPPSQEEQQRKDRIMQQYSDVFKGIGLLNVDTAKLHIDPSIPLVVAAYRPVPLAYREKLSQHLQELRDKNKIEDVDPSQHCTWISNVVVSEKKDKCTNHQNFAGTSSKRQKI